MSLVEDTTQQAHLWPGVARDVSTFRLEWLVAASSLPAESPEEALARRVSFARYVSTLESGAAVEFRFTARSGGDERQVEVLVLLHRPRQVGVDGSGFDGGPHGFLSALRSHFPEAEFVEVPTPATRLGQPDLAWKFEHALLEVPESGGLPTPDTRIGFLTPKEAVRDAPETALNLVIPWRPTTSDWRRVAEMLHWSEANLTLRIVAQPAPLRENAAETEILASVATCDELSSRDAPVPTSHDVEMIRRRIVERRNALLSSSLLLSVTLFGDGPVPRETAAMLASEIAGRLEGSSDPWAAGAGAVAFGLVEDGFTTSYVPSDEVRLRDLFTAEEAASALRLPSPPVSHLDGFPIRRFRTSAAPSASWSPGHGSLFLGVNAHRGIQSKIHLSVEERRRHVYVAGQTGTGKSTLLERMMLEDIRAGHGLALFDPHGDLVENILCRMSPERANDVVLFDFAESERPIAFNPLLWSTLAERDFVIEEFIASILARLPADQVGPVFETFARNFLKLLMGDAPRPDYTPSFADFPLLFQRPGFRKKLLSTMSDETVIDFINEAESNNSSEMRLSSMAAYITSKFSRFVGSDTVMRTIGQPGSAIDFREAMDERKIILVNLAKGRVGQISAELLCSLLIARFRAAAMGRVDQPIEGRRDFTLYVDEFQNVASSSYSELLSEARKYRLSLVLANQYIAQLPQHVTQSILGNVGCIFSFRVGVNDAKVLADVFEPTFGARDLVELPILHAYVSCLIGGGEVSRPFSIRCPREWPEKDYQLAHAIRQNSLQRWGTDVSEIDAALKTRRAYIEGLE